MTMPTRRTRHRFLVAVTLSSTLLGISWISAAHASEHTETVGPGKIVVLDANSGRQLWSISQKNSQRSYIHADIGKGLVVATSEICERANITDERAEAFDAETGDRLWIARQSHGGASDKTMFWSTTPTVEVAAQGTVVTPGSRWGTNMTGLDAKTGKTAWTLPTLHELGVSHGLVFGAKRGDVVATVLAAHDRRTGDHQWDFPLRPDPQWGNTFDVVAATQDIVVVAAGNYLTSNSNGPPTAPTWLFILDARTGIERARFGPTLQFGLSNFTIAGNVISFVDSGILVGRSLTDGSLLWQAPPGISGGKGANDGRTVFYEKFSTGTLTAIDTITGTERWATHGHVLVSDGKTTLVGPSERGAGTLRALDTATGLTQWKVQVSGFQHSALYASASHGRIALSTNCVAD